MPAADWASKITDELPDAPPADVDEPFTATVAAAIKKLTYTPVTTDDFDLHRVPAHLRVTFAVVDERGRTVGADKDLDALQHRLRDATRDSVARVTQGGGRDERGRGRGRGRGGAGGDTTPVAPRPTSSIEREGLTSWDFDELPAVVDTRHGDTVIRAYPALVDDGDSVSIHVDGDARRPGPRDAEGRAAPADARRPRRPIAYVQQHLTSAEKLILATSPYQNTSALFADCLVAVVDDVLFRVKPDGMVMTEEGVPLDARPGLGGRHGPDVPDRLARRPHADRRPRRRQGDEGGDDHGPARRR